MRGNSDNFHAAALPETRRGASQDSSIRLNAGIHLVLVDEFAARHLVDPDLYLLLEPLVLGKHAGYGFLDQVIRSTPGSEGELVQLGFLIFG